MIQTSNIYVSTHGERVTLFACAAANEFILN